MDPRYKDLQQCIFANIEELRRFRQLVVNLVLSTDHFNAEIQQKRLLRWKEAFYPPQNNDRSSEFKLAVITEHMMQAAHLVHTAQNWPTYRLWNERLFEEQSIAYQSKRTKNNPIIDWYENELRLFDAHAIPLIEKLHDSGILKNTLDLLTRVRENRREWSVAGGEIVEEMQSRVNFDVAVKEEN